MNGEACGGVRGPALPIVVTLEISCKRGYLFLKIQTSDFLFLCPCFWPSVKLYYLQIIFVFFSSTIRRPYLNLTLIQSTTKLMSFGKLIQI